jgi:2'-hydroxyisoflavone reductase
MKTRREFLRLSALAAGAIGSGIVAPHRVGALDHDLTGDDAPGRATGARPPRRALRVLVLGGTGFIGPHLVRTLLERGHVPTLFNRGRTEPGLFPELFPALETLIGDRNDDIGALAGREWDAVIDDSGYTPQQVRATARLLRGAVAQYLFTSTRGVYADFTASPMDEDAPLGMAGVPTEQWTGYGPLKALAEREVLDAFPTATTIVRPAIITGPGDNTDRFTYWYVRVDRGGEMLAPGDPRDPIQYTDVRDLAEFYVHLLETRTNGVFNLLGPRSPLSAAEFLYGLRATTASPVGFTWASWDFLETHGLRGGRELAAWRPPAGEFLNYGRVQNRRAIAAGLRFRPLAETVVDTRDWWYSLGLPRLRSGPTAEKEAEVLAAWHARG